MKKLVYVVLCVLLFQACKEEDKISGRTWEGYLYKGISKQNPISKVALKISNDTLFLFSNAIFGADNDTLIIKENDNGISYESINGEIFNHLNINLMYPDPNNKEREVLHVFSIESNDMFEIWLDPSLRDISDEGMLDFYENRQVPRQLYKYLEGIYEGKARFNNATTGLFLSQSGGIEVKVTFLPNWQLQMCVKSLLFSLFSSAPAKPHCTVLDYHIEGDKIILDNSKSGIKELQISDYGRQLLIIKDDFTVKLKK